MSDTLPERFSARMGALLGPDFPAEIGLAVSGGGDSMAMLALAHEWARPMGIGLRVVTINHGLRAEARDEAEMVARECAALGHPHAVLDWQWDGQGNLQQAARNARRSLIDAWRGDIVHVLMAHTRDDQAETVLLRLARGSGVDGLAAMAARSRVWSQADLGAEGHRGSYEILRPLLDISRADLRHYIAVLKVPFVDDPSNADPRFDRVAARRALAVLGHPESGIGLDADGLAQTAKRLGAASRALRSRATDAALRSVREGPHGELVVACDTYAGFDVETRLRILAAAIQFVNGEEFRPRFKGLEQFDTVIRAGGNSVLAGVRAEQRGANFELFREYQAVSNLRVPAPGIWDGRWHVTPAEPDGAGALDGLTIRPLGEEGWLQIPASMRATAPRHSLSRSLPALFRGPALAGFAPAGFGVAHSAQFRPAQGSFVASLESH